MWYFLIPVVYLIVWGILAYRAFHKDRKKVAEGYYYAESFFVTMLFGFACFAFTISMLMLHYEHWHGCVSQEVVFEMIDDAKDDVDMKTDIRSALLDDVMTQVEYREIYRNKKNRKLDNFIYGD